MFVAHECRQALMLTSTCCLCLLNVTFTAVCVLAHISACLPCLQLCKAIPKGQVSTYGAMAAVLNSSARAVGQVWRNAPCLIAVGVEMNATFYTSFTTLMPSRPHSPSSFLPFQLLLLLVLTTAIAVCSLFSSLLSCPTPKQHTYTPLSTSSRV